eukprot:3142736-Lingulodinium_polyedra.AAC.1
MSAPFIGSMGFEAADVEGTPVPVVTEVDEAVFRGGETEGPQVVDPDEAGAPPQTEVPPTLASA